MTGTVLPRPSLDTLLLLPCSGSKRHGSMLGSTTSILTQINEDLAGSLREARGLLRQQSRVDDTLMPAYRRYSGALYEEAAQAIGEGLENGHHILIVSGGFGVLRADESIGWYEQSLRLSAWPRGLLEECILDYVQRHHIRSIVALVARTSEYAKLVRRIARSQGTVPTRIASPVIGPGEGAQGKVPRAIGEASRLLFADGISGDWRSSNGLALRCPTT